VARIVTKLKMILYRQMNIADVQTVRKIALFLLTALATIAFALTGSAHPANSAAHLAIKWSGVGLIAICIVGRTWSSLYIGGRKIVMLVTIGPYSITRNPLYFFSIIGAAGIAAQVGSIVIVLVCMCAVFLVFLVVVHHEERLLLKRHRGLYFAYLKRVPRFIPNPLLWCDEPTLTVRQNRVYLTFADALLFLLAVPLAQVCKYLQSTGLLPVLVLLP
jgi:protein-S-isoprenylcysteine O-methyltransferase Ste14